MRGCFPEFDWIWRFGFAARNCGWLLLLVAAIAGVLLALARPQWGFAWEEAQFKGLDIIVAIDTSRSMLAKDAVPPDPAGSGAKYAAIDLMRLAKNDRLGLRWRLPAGERAFFAGAVDGG